MESKRQHFFAERRHIVYRLVDNHEYMVWDADLLDDEVEPTPTRRKWHEWEPIAVVSGLTLGRTQDGEGWRYVARVIDEPLFASSILRDERYSANVKLLGVLDADYSGTNGQVC